MSCDRGSGRHRATAGFSLVELIVVLAIAGIVAALSVPMLLSFWQASTLQAAARELASAINLGRQLAISTKTSVCVELSASSLRLRMGGCGGEVWKGAVTDGSGAINISGAADVDAAANGRVVFTALGAASPAATYTLTHARTRASRAVVVAASGRISVE